MLEQLRLILKALPWTGPAIIVGLVLALFSMALFTRRRTVSDRIGFGLVVWCLVVAGVVTLSPVKNDYFGVPTTGCDWSIWRPLAREYWFSSGSRPPNVWLLFPAGVGVMLMDGFWRKFLGIATLFALPPGIEALQDYYPELKRSCSSQDVADNWTGLVIGLAVGLVLALLVGVIRFVRRRTQAREGRRRAALEAQNRKDPGPYGWDDGDAAASRESASLPLGGGTHRGQYSEFSDFDDRPNSTRWFEETRQMPESRDERDAGGVDDTPAMGYERSASTPSDASPNDGRGMWAEWSTETRSRAPRTQQGPDSAAEGATRIMPSRGQHLPPSADAEKTQILRDRREP